MVLISAALHHPRDPPTGAARRQGRPLSFCPLSLSYLGAISIDPTLVSLSLCMCTYAALLSSLFFSAPLLLCMFVLFMGYLILFLVGCPLVHVQDGERLGMRAAQMCNHMPDVLQKWVNHIGDRRYKERCVDVPRVSHDTCVRSGEISRCESDWKDPQCDPFTAACDVPSPCCLSVCR
jgi:hypothetical protein